MKTFILERAVPEELLCFWEGQKGTRGIARWKDFSFRFDDKTVMNLVVGRGSSREDPHIWVQLLGEDGKTVVGRRRLAKYHLLGRHSATTFSDNKRYTLRLLRERPPAKPFCSGDRAVVVATGKLVTVEIVNPPIWCEKLRGARSATKSIWCDDGKGYFHTDLRRVDQQEKTAKELVVDGREFSTPLEAALHLLWLIQRLCYYEKHREGEPADGPRFREGILEARKLLKALNYEAGTGILAGKEARAGG